MMSSSVTFKFTGKSVLVTGAAGGMPYVHFYAVFLSAILCILPFHVFVYLSYGRFKNQHWCECFSGFSM